MNEKNVGTEMDLVKLIGIAIVIALVAGALGYGIGTVASRGLRGLAPLKSNLGKSNLSGNYVELGLTEPKWEPMITPSLPDKQNQDDTDLLLYAVDDNGQIQYVIARFSLADPKSTVRFYVVNITMKSPDTVTAEYIGEITGHYILYSNRLQCWIEIPHTGQQNADGTACIK